MGRANDGDGDDEESHPPMATSLAAEERGEREKAAEEEEEEKRALGTILVGSTRPPRHRFWILFKDMHKKGGGR